MEGKGLSAARVEKALRAESGIQPKFHKGKYGKQYDYHTCGQCGYIVTVTNNYCGGCGYRILWNNPRCLTGYEEEHCGL